FMILTLVAAGVGVALISAEVADIMPSGAVFVPLRGPQTYLHHAVAWSADNPSGVLASVLAVAEEVLPTPTDCADYTHGRCPIRCWTAHGPACDPRGHDGHPSGRDRGLRQHRGQ